jgi:hypothetical protein
VGILDCLSSKFRKPFEAVSYYFMTEQSKTSPTENDLSKWFNLQDSLAGKIPPNTSKNPI